MLYKVDNSNPIRYHCVCDCGTERDVISASLRRGITKSCGCFAREQSSKLSKTHGCSKEKLYTIWNAMKNRCYCKKHIDYKWYSAFNVQVCDEWKSDYLAFRSWALKNGYKDGMSIDRIDYTGNYCPENCRFATPKEQANNRRTNINVEYNGKVQTLKQWAEELDIPYLKLYQQYVIRKHSFEDALKKLA